MIDKDGVSIQAKMKPRYTKANARILKAIRYFGRLFRDKAIILRFILPKLARMVFLKVGRLVRSSWLYHPERVSNFSRYASAARKFNTVVSKGIASAHAESENLSPEKRKAVFEFLKDSNRKGWHVVQVSSGESCPHADPSKLFLHMILKMPGLLNIRIFMLFLSHLCRDAQRCRF